MSDTPLRVRRLREQLAAVDQYVSDLEAPIREELRRAPLLVAEGLAAVLTALDAVDSVLAKVDGSSGAVGSRVTLTEVWK